MSNRHAASAFASDATRAIALLHPFIVIAGVALGSACYDPVSSNCNPVVALDCGPIEKSFVYNLTVAIATTSGDSVAGVEVVMTAPIFGEWKTVWTDTTDVSGRVFMSFSIGTGRNIAPRPFVLTVTPPAGLGLAPAVREDTLVAVPRDVQRTIPVVLTPP